jgi:short-subunit dehydrogenase involved in D-alanine esterification of teichoic acids
MMHMRGVVRDVREMSRAGDISCCWICKTNIHQRFCTQSGLTLQSRSSCKMSFGYKKVLLVGATSGIGLALAERLVDNGVFVIVLGRRKERLDAFVAKHGKDKADMRVYDATKLEEVGNHDFRTKDQEQLLIVSQAKPFVDEVFKAHPDIDFVHLNFGIQRSMDFTKPETLDFSKFDTELLCNYTAPVRLTAALLPYLKNRQAGLALTTSQLALVTLTSRPNYCSSKAALHSFIVALRAQLAKDAEYKRLKIVEIFPPAVQTELHDAHNQPDIKNGHLIGMPLVDFTDECWKQLIEGKEDIAVGSAKEFYDRIEPTRAQADREWNAAMDEALKAF